MWNEMNISTASQLADIKKEREREEKRKINQQYDWPIFEKLTEYIEISEKNYHAVIEQNKILEKMYNDAAKENLKLEKYNKKMAFISVFSLVVAILSLLFSVIFSIVMYL